MIRSRLGLKALGMCALVLGLMAVWAGAAQAEEPGGTWTYLEIVKEKNEKGETIELKILKTFEGALAEPEIGGEVDTVGVLHSEALEGSSILYECKKFSTVAGSKLKANGVALGKLLFSECEAFIKGKLEKACEPKEGKVTTNLIKAQMLLHKLADGTKDKILIAEPDETTQFAFIESTASCALGIKVPVGGKFAIQTGTQAEATEHKVKHLIKEFAPLTALWILTNTAEHKANILGSAWAFLTGAHVGLEFAGLWK
jgi:hypothetical protein